MEKNFQTHECVELVANKGYVMTNFKEGDTTISYSTKVHVSLEEVDNYYAMEEYIARMKQIELNHAMKVQRDIEREARKKEREEERAKREAEREAKRQAKEGNLEEASEEEVNTKV